MNNIAIVSAIGITLLIAGLFALMQTTKLEYDDLCTTHFWTETINTPDQHHVRSLLQEQLKEKLEWNISSEQIRFWDEKEEFVVRIPGDWDGRDAPKIVVKETLEDISEIIRVKDIRVVCA